MSGETISGADATPRGRAPRAVPGVLLVFAGGRPQLAALAIDAPRVIGRDTLAQLGVDDQRLSRKHAELAASAGKLVVRDLESRNGTFVGGERLTGERVVGPDCVIRIGDSLLVTCADVQPFVDGSVELDDDAVIGPRLRRVWVEIASAAAAGMTLHIQGETGAGKELAARQFHRASGREAGPFVAVNCATIPPALAERLLFGVRKGAYSGADADVDGYLQAADGGTLFLDELAELSLEVQAKLLRVIETHNVLPLGATRARTVDVRIVAATHRDLRAEAAAGRFRDDLYYRVGRPSVMLPPLRERREEIAWLLRALLGRHDAALKLHASFVEAVLARPWPGNVRELASELIVAIAAARAAGATMLEAAHLAPRAGMPLGASVAAVPVAAASVDPDDSDAGPEVARIVRALAEHGGKVATAARALGLHRNQLRRLISRHNLAPGSAQDDDDSR